MTLVLTCLTERYCVQAADRRLTMPDGSLYDDDTNKAVFYCGRVAVAYSGLAIIDGVETAEWVARQMYDVPQLKPALEQVAQRATNYFATSLESDKRLAVVATGWATQHGQPPTRPFCSICTNFLNDSGGWADTAGPDWKIEVVFLPADAKAMVIAIGNPLRQEEHKYLIRQARKCVERGTGPRPFVRLLGQQIQTISQGTDFRSGRVGNGLIVHSLSKAAIEQKATTIVTPIADHFHSFFYVRADGATDQFQGAVIACNGMLLTAFGGGTIPPEARASLRGEECGPPEEPTRGFEPRTPSLRVKCSTS